jgi:8-oxo-dGTP diphosphatase
MPSADYQKLVDFYDSIHFDDEEYGDDWADNEELFDEEEDEEEGEDVELAKQEADDDIPLSAKAIIYDAQNRFLVLDDAYTDYVDLPGGHLHDGEAPIDGLMREVEEETGLKLCNIEEVFAKVVQLAPDKRRLSTFYLAQVDGDDTLVQLSEEHLDYAWVTLEESEDYNLGIYHTILDEIFRKEKYHGGIVCFAVPEQLARKIAIPGFEEPQQLHITIAFIPYDGRTKPDWYNQVVGVIKEIGEPPLEGEIIGLERFRDIKNCEKDNALVALANIPGLHSWRALLDHCLATETELSASTDHDFKPHITLGYLDTEEPNPLDFIEQFPFMADGLSIWMDDDHRNVVFDDVESYEIDAEEDNSDDDSFLANPK